MFTASRYAFWTIPLLSSISTFISRICVVRPSNLISLSTLLFLKCLLLLPWSVFVPTLQNSCETLVSVLYAFRHFRRGKRCRSFLLPYILLKSYCESKALLLLKSQNIRSLASSITYLLKIFGHKQKHSILYHPISLHIIHRGPALTTKAPPCRPTTSHDLNPCPYPLFTSTFTSTFSSVSLKKQRKPWWYNSQLTRILMFSISRSLFFDTFLWESGDC